MLKNNAKKYISLSCLLSYQKNIKNACNSTAIYQYNNPYNHKKFTKIYGEYGFNDLTKWRNQKYFSTWQSRDWETGKPGMLYTNENSFSRWIIEKSDGLTTLGLQKLSETLRDYAYLILTSQTSMRGPIVGHEA